MKFDSRANLHVPVDEPLIVDNPDQYPWDRDVDVAVVGLGLAGASAALEAADHGARVLVLDRLGGGGASGISGGVVYAGGGTRQQREADVEDTPENMYEYLRVQVGGVVSDETLRRFCHESVVNLEWLEHFGVRFSSRYYKEKNSFPGGAWGLYHSGNEAYAPYNANSTSAARGHVTQGGGYFGGPGLMRPLIEALCRRYAERVELLRFAEVFGLIVDSRNNVVGVRYRLGSQGGPVYALRASLHWMASKINIAMPRGGAPLRKLAGLLSVFDREQSVRVRKGVVLSAGGFIFNKPMVEQATGARLLTPHALGEDCNGSGIRLGLTRGAATDRIDRLTYWRFYAPPHAWLKALAVGTSGKRLCNEALYGATVADVMREKSGGRGWLILDKPLMQEAYVQLRSDMALIQKLMSLMYIVRCTRKATTAADLARKIGVPVDVLETTLQTYNQSIADGGTDEYAKPDKYRMPLGNSHYYAIDISIGSKFPCPTLTLGGLRVNEKSGLVIDGEGREIAGLYAAGRNAVGLCAHTYISGLSLADCLFSGRRAGRHAATGSIPSASTSA